ncbi:uncharacterized protein L201_004819 [Kwoniella dendrophila CBS 6074]|uniref:Ribosome biogenesis protein NSA1 n=1 Tax=Kwoniella dendrophila CBS 6074 TaxID=1295534 RepID=A0AAX4JWR2_9TREE
MVQTQTINFLLPSLHPNTLVDLAFPVPTLGLVPSAPEPIIQHLPIKYDKHQPIGRSKFLVKSITSSNEDQIIIADDKFQVSTLNISSLHEENPAPPLIVKQDNVKGRSKDVWAGIVNVQGGVVSALTSGHLTYHSTTSSSAEPPSGSSSSSTNPTRSVPSPLQCLTSTSLLPNSFVTAGKEVDVSIWDIERTFGSSNSEVSKTWDNGKRKKIVYEAGQTWQAKNVPQNNLSLRQPINHLSLTYLNDSPHFLVSGTKAGTIRRYDTRQRKPLSDWKVAREGGIGCVASGIDHELFFSDHSNLLGSLDLRTGKILYAYSSMTCTPHQLLPLPLLNPEKDHEPAIRRIGLGSISSDATFRLHSSTNPPKEESMKSNFGGEGKKGEILKIVGGIGIGQGLFRGYSERDIKQDKPEKKNKGEIGDERDEEEDDDEDDELDEEQVWDNINEVVEDKGKLPLDEDDEDYSSESDIGEEDKVIIKSKPKKKVRKV